MLLRVRTMFRKLRCGGSKPAPSPPTTTVETDDPSPRAIHMSEVRREDIRRPPTKPRRAASQSILILVADAKGATDYSHLFRLLQRETDFGCEFDGHDEFDTTYFCDDYTYEVFFHKATGAYGSAWLDHMQHAFLVLTYDASSRESWDEVVAQYEIMRSQCEDGDFPFLATMIAAMGEGEGSVSHEEAETFASQRACLFVKFSPVTGRGVCKAIGSLVELAHGARDQHFSDQDLRSEGPGMAAYRERIRKRSEAIVALF
ncbi:hypothetical protein C8A00DRAFT_37885 [Chaetomidium leptoderma]|uniref:Uncharacterized protein n=1 Tax=Chaetomidium leptoderma TaxID=669021 RepID=A0AAN6ZTC3_9PEZI|nr:hypothetical protein C8A00DRAFT_37885 [Chaetomidium leptoderma]